MYLKALIEELEKHDERKVVRFGFRNPHSYRGYYSELAFEPAANISVLEMLKCAKEALGSTYTGWKGGDFTMNEFVEVYLAYRGDTGEELGPKLLEYMLAAVFKADESYDDRSHFSKHMQGDDL